MSLVEQSEELHARVRAFATGQSERRDTFERLALDLAHFQARHSPGYARLVELNHSTLDRVESIPAVPTDAFRLTRVAVHPPELDEVRFFTSGTTGPPGVHALRTTLTYQQLALRQGRARLLSDWVNRPVVVALAPAPGPRPSSSLGFMMRLFMMAFDGRALVAEPAGAPFDPDSPDRWLLGPCGVDVVGLKRAGEIARARQEPLVVLATAFALVLLLDALGSATLPVPRRSVVMQTGGFKGRTREIPPAELRARVARAFHIAPQQVVGEYGMTELTSQLYQAEQGLDGEPEAYLEPPWLRVVPVDPVSLEPVGEGETGIARIVDLGNVDSAVVILTQDLVRRRAGRVELLGRRPGAVARGCSLAAEALVAPGAKDRSEQLHRWSLPR